MLAQRDLFAAPEMPALDVEPNEHGCYPAEMAERLECPNPRKGWRGVPWAEIELLHIPEGWIFSTASMLPESGHGGPLTKHRVYPSRGEAIDAAVAELRTRFAGRLSGPDVKAAQIVVKWLDGLA